MQRETKRGGGDGLSRFARTGLAAGLVAAGLLTAGPLTALGLGTAATAKERPAKCFNSDEGHYACQFTSTDRDGSFEISAHGKPTYILNIEEPGIASGFVNLGTRNIFLPGRFHRSKSDGACWDNDDTKFRICVW